MEQGDLEYFDVIKNEVFAKTKNDQNQETTYNRKFDA